MEALVADEGPRGGSQVDPTSIPVGVYVAAAILIMVLVLALAIAGFVA